MTAQRRPLPVPPLIPPPPQFEFHILLLSNVSPDLSIIYLRRPDDAVSRESVLEHATDLT